LAHGHNVVDALERIVGAYTRDYAAADITKPGRTQAQKRALTFRVRRNAATKALLHKEAGMTLAPLRKRA
jgi:hypothetical protein